MAPEATARQAYGARVRRYETDLSDEEWRLVEAWIPPDPGGGRPRSTDLRAVCDAATAVAFSVSKRSTGAFCGLSGHPSSTPSVPRVPWAPPANAGAPETETDAVGAPPVLRAAKACQPRRAMLPDATLSASPVWPQATHVKTGEPFGRLALSRLPHSGHSRLV